MMLLNFGDPYLYNIERKEKHEPSSGEMPIAVASVYAQLLGEWMDDWK
jgi:hypothetical protein